MPDPKPTGEDIFQKFANDPNLRLRMQLAASQIAVEDEQARNAILETEAARFDAQRDSDRQQHSHEIGLVTAAASYRAEKTRPNTPNISEVFNRYKAAKIALGKEGHSGGWKDGEDTARYDHLPHIRRLIEVAGGDKPSGTLTEEDVQRFFDDTIALAGVTANTKKQRLGRVSTFLTWANSKKYLSQDLTPILKWGGNFKKVHFQPFSADDLILLFESDEYRQEQFTKPWQYWLPILGLFTGARLNELAQLRVIDVSSREGVTTLAILDQDGLRTKNESSVRTLPMHPKLIELGLSAPKRN
jgi:integrase